MKVSVDHRIVRMLSQEGGKGLGSKLGDHGYLSFNWASLLEYLDLGQLFSQVPPFDSTPIYTATISALCEVENLEDLFYIYDSLFTAMIKQIKSLPEMDALFLLQKIEEKKKSPSFLQVEKILIPALAIHERMLRDRTSHAMHDLVLYLAWDRMCICMARIFDYRSNHPIFIENVKRLKWCLIESYNHITSDGKTSPSFYRLTEALFYYQMREEHTHPKAEWELLTKSFPALKDPNELHDFFYIDEAIRPASKTEEESHCHMTVDPPEMVQSRFDLAQYIIGRLKEEIPQWNYRLYPSGIVHL